MLSATIYIGSIHALNKSEPDARHEAEGASRARRAKGRDKSQRASEKKMRSGRRPREEGNARAKSPSPERDRQRADGVRDSRWVTRTAHTESLVGAKCDRRGGCDRA